MPKIVREYGLGRSAPTTLNIAADGKVVRVAAVLDDTVEKLKIWVLSDHGAQQASRVFLPALNDESVPNDVLYHGTATFDSGKEMVHVFEVV